MTKKMTFERDAKKSNSVISTNQGKVRNFNYDIANLKNENEMERPVDIDAFEEDIDKKSVLLDQTKTKLVTEEAKLVTTNEEHENSKIAHEEAERRLNEKKDRIIPLDQEMTKVENEIKKSKQSKDHYTDKKKDYQSRIEAAQKVLDEKRSKLGDLEAKAKVWSEERISTRKKVDSLSRELVKMKESLRTQEERQESRQLVTEKYEQYRLSYSKADEQIKYMAKTVEFLEGMLEERKKGFNQIRRSTCKTLNRNFTVQLTVRKFIGKLVFNHKEKTLTIVVNPDANAEAAALDTDRDIRSLSGGEKSYSSVSLIMSMWEAMTPPFRALDEFDVFMDSVNRKIALDNIINYATSDRKFQFIFLTPLNTDSIQGNINDVHILKLRKEFD